MNSAVRRPPLVPRVDRAAPLQFLRTGYEADDWIAVFLKRYEGPRRLEDPVHAERNGSSSKIIPNAHGHPPGTHADAEVIDEAETGPRRGLTVSGFVRWERRAEGHVTFPARSFTVNGARRGFVLLRRQAETRARRTRHRRACSTRTAGSSCTGPSRVAIRQTTGRGPLSGGPPVRSNPEFTPVVGAPYGASPRRVVMPALAPQ